MYKQNRLRFHVYCFCYWETEETGWQWRRWRRKLDQISGNIVEKPRRRRRRKKWKKQWSIFVEEINSKYRLDLSRKKLKLWNRIAINCSAIDGHIPIGLHFIYQCWYGINWLVALIFSHIKISRKWISLDKFKTVVQWLNGTILLLSSLSSSTPSSSSSSSDSGTVITDHLLSFIFLGDADVQLMTNSNTVQWLIRTRPLFLSLFFFLLLLLLRLL